MCLNVIKKIRTKKKYGFKIFIKKNNKLFSIFQGDKDKEYPLNEALHEFDFRTTPENYSPSDYIFSYSPGAFYQKGFHIYLKRRDAEKKLLDIEYPNYTNDYLETLFAAWVKK